MQNKTSALPTDHFPFDSPTSFNSPSLKYKTPISLAKLRNKLWASAVQISVQSQVNAGFASAGSQSSVGRTNGFFYGTWHDNKASTSAAASRWKYIVLRAERHLVMQLNERRVHSVMHRREMSLNVICSVHVVIRSFYDIHSYTTPSAFKPDFGNKSVSTPYTLCTLIAWTIINLSHRRCRMRDVERATAFYKLISAQAMRFMAVWQDFLMQKPSAGDFLLGIRDGV